MVADLLDYEPSEPFDLIVAAYLQLPADLRAPIHRKLVAMLAPGGEIFIIAHHARNLSEGIGGPDYREVLYTEADLAADFADLAIERNEAVRRDVDRGEIEGTAIDLLFLGRRSA